MENTRFIIVSVFLAACIVISQCDEGSTECTNGTACFPNGMPPTLTPSNPAFYCCLEKNMTRHSEDLPDGTKSCICKPDFTLDSKIQNWADNTMHEGRMCSREEDCVGSKNVGTVNSRFKTCCWHTRSGHPTVNITTTIFDGDKEEYIGCRCHDDSFPTPDAAAYTVPPVLSYNSSGEVCQYDKACEDNPYVKCQSPGVTFCCYGSRGIVTENEGQVTHCTCTNQLFLEHCHPNPVTIALTTMPCQADCAGRADKYTDANNEERCCPNNMIVVALKTAGNFTSCACRAQAPAQAQKKSDEDASSAARLSCSLCDLIVFAVATLSLAQIARH